MARFDGRVLAVALQALLLACGRESRQPERPAATPSPAVQPQAVPPAEPAPAPKAGPQKTPKDTSDIQNYPWQSGPIASL